MTPDLRQRFERIERQKQTVLSNIAGWPAEQIRFRPKPAAWSALDVLDHIVKTEQATFAIARKQLPNRTPVSFSDRMRGMVVIAVMQSPVRVKVPAAATMVLPANTDLPEISSRWAAVRLEIFDLLQSLQPENSRCGLFRHPVSGWMDVSQTLAFTSAHLRHHVYQLDRLKSASRMG